MANLSVSRTNNKHKPIMATEATREVETTRVRMMKNVSPDVCDDEGNLRLGALLRWLDACIPLLLPAVPAVRPALAGRCPTRCSSRRDLVS